MVYAFTGITVGNWHPLTMLSHMLDCQLFGVEEGAGWHHVVNLALHAANTLLLFIVLGRMTGAFWRSALVAALFGLHPLHVESVAWISERKDVLSTLFFMLTLMAYYRYVQRPTLLRYAAVFMLLALGLMSKPMLVTAPFVLLLLDYWPLGRMSCRDDSCITPQTRRNPKGAAGPVPLVTTETVETEQPPTTKRTSSRFRVITEKIPLLLLAGMSAAITYLVQQSAGAMGMLGPQLPFGRGWAMPCFPMDSTWKRPSGPAPWRQFTPMSIASDRRADCRSGPGRDQRGGLPPGQNPAFPARRLVLVSGHSGTGDRLGAGRHAIDGRPLHLYSAHWHFCHCRLGRAEFTEDWPARNKAIAAAGLLALCGWCPSRQVTFWSSSEALLPCRGGRALQFRGDVRAWHGLLEGQEKLDEELAAQEQFEAILKFQSDPTVRMEGGLEPVHRALGLLLALRHQPRKALEELEEAIKERPQQPEPRRHLAWILATSLDDKVRDGMQAVEATEQALQLSRWKLPEYWDTLAAAQAEAGMFREAVETEQKALQQAQLMRTDDLTAGIQRRLELFKSGTPYHAPAQRPQRI